MACASGTEDGEMSSLEIGLIETTYSLESADGDVAHVCALDKGTLSTFLRQQDHQMQEVHGTLESS